MAVPRRASRSPEDEGSHTHPKDFDVSDAAVAERADAFARPDPSTFCRLDELGLVVNGQRLWPDAQIWRAGCWNLTDGAAAAAAKGRHATR